MAGVERNLADCRRDDKVLKGKTRVVLPGTNGRRAAEVCVEVAQAAARAQRGEHDEGKADRNLKPDSQTNYLYQY